MSESRSFDADDIRREEHSGADEALRRDVLLSRAVAGDAHALAAVRARSAADPAILEELALWQADELRVTRAARALDARADLVETPLLSQRSGIREGRVREGRVREGLGWAVAAALALLFVGRAWLPLDESGASSKANVAGFAGFNSSDDAFAAYVQKAREEGVMIGDVAPPTLIDSREIHGSGGFEVIIMRQVYERRKAPVLYRVAPTNELGELKPIIIRPRTESMQ